MAQMLKLEDRNSLVLSKNSSDHSMKNYITHACRINWLYIEQFFAKTLMAHSKI